MFVDVLGLIKVLFRQTTVGAVKYSPEDNEVVWTIKSFPVRNTWRKGSLTFSRSRVDYW